jgi:multiple sugar transport system permease protein
LWTLNLGVTDLRLTGLAAAEPQFVGLENFVEAISDSKFVNSVKMTIPFVGGSLIGTGPVGVRPGLDLSELKGTRPPAARSGGRSGTGGGSLTME